MRVALKNRKGDKEETKDFYFYNARAAAAGDATVGGPGQSIVCNGCDSSMNTLYAILARIRNVK
jgi:hypothetical protein